MRYHITHGSSAPKGRPEGWLRIGEVAERAGVTKATIRHYVRLGLLPEPVQTNRRMAYYDPESVRIVGFIRELREKRFLPLSAIRRVLESGGEAGVRGVDAGVLDDRRAQARYTKAELLERCPVGEAVLDQLVGARVLTPTGGRFSEEDADVLRAVHGMRQAGLDERRGFDPALLGIHVGAVERLIDREFAIFNERLLGKEPPEEVARLARVAIELTSRILAAIHRRRLLARLGALAEDPITDRGGAG